LLVCNLKDVNTVALVCLGFNAIEAAKAGMRVNRMTAERRMMYYCSRYVILQERRSVPEMKLRRRVEEWRQMGVGIYLHVGWFKDLR